MTQLLLIAALLATGTVLVTQSFVVGRSLFRASGEAEIFPTVTGNNLDRQTLEFPRDFAGRLNLLFIPFLREQQQVVDTWVPFARDLEATHPGVVYYELPTIYDMSPIGRTFLNEGMRAGIPDPLSRQRTVTLYLDLEPFMKVLGIPSRSRVQVLLVRDDGRILWRTTGPYTPEAAEALMQVVEPALRGE